MTALNLKKQQNTVAVIIAVISILFLLVSCGGGGGGGGGVAAPATDEESTAAGSSSTASTSSPAAPAVTETARYTVNGVTYIIMSNGTVNASNADGSARAITSSASGSTYTITDANKTLIISIGTGGTAMITVTDSDTGATQTLYATSGGTATAVTRTVSFVTNGGTAIDDIEVPDSNAAVLPNASGKSTWNFYKWYTDSSLTTQYNTSAPVTENITLYAVWARSYTIDGASYSVLSNGKVIKADGTVVGTAAEPFNSVSFTDGGKAVSITVSGSTTTATVTEGGNTRTFTDNGSGSLSPVMRTVTFDSKGGSSVTAVSVADGSGITAPASPSKQGYTFAGWCTDSGATTAYSFGTPVTGNITLYAKWTAGSVTYTVKHLQQNVSGSGYTEVTADRQSLGGTTGSQTSAAAKTYTGFTAQSITQQTVAADSSTVVEIKYNRNNITYTFNANGGNWNGSTANKTVSGLYGATVSRPADPTKTGCTFSAWSSTVPSTFGATDTTFTASWNVNSYKVKFNANGGTGTMSDQSIAYGSSASLTANAFAKTGHTFAGWATSTTGAAAYANGASYTMNSTSDVTLYAVWTANTYKVTFNKNGGSGTMADQTFTYGTAQALTASTFTRTGYTFSGWATSATGAKVYNGGQSVSNLSPTNGANVTLYAVWTLTQYTITYNLNGGTNSASNPAKYTMETADITLANPTRSGYGFCGWFTNNTFAASSRKKVISTGSTGAVTLYAKWIQLPAGFVYVEGNDTIVDMFVCDHEVTQGEYETYCTYGGSSPSDAKGKGSSYPAYYVSWYDALVYCNKRSRAEGLTPCYTINSSTNPADWGSVPTSSNATWNAVTVNSSANGYRLPTNAEWEYAAKGGSAQESYKYSGSNNIQEVSWNYYNSEFKTHPVKGKKANSLGIYDMTGNVYEWCFYVNSLGAMRIRGGAYYQVLECAVSEISNQVPYCNDDSAIGFRVVRNAN